MAELHPPEVSINVATTPSSIPTAASLTAPAPPADNIIAIAPDANNNNLGTTLAPKRQRRPSVRLGEIGDQPAGLSYDSHARRPRPWRFHRDPNLAAKTSKTRPLTNLVSNGRAEFEFHDADGENDFGSRKAKSKRPLTKRVRTNWTAKADNEAEADSREDNENNLQNFRDFEPENSESPLKEQSPIHSVGNDALDFWHGNRRTIRARVSESRGRDPDDGLPESDRKFGSNSGRDGDRGLDDGVRSWLIGLGLGRYSPVFEIHEVDDEALPMLTLEDLKDMGINAVGSRRKMYSAIQKLGKGFS